MQTIKDIFSLAPLMAWSAVSVMLAMVVMALNWPKVKWWWHNTWYSFPLIGKIARLSKDSNKDTVDPTWFKAEKTLCRDYKQFIRIQDEHDFNEKITYLTKAGDIGRRETPARVWMVTIVLVFAEAMGFSYVLAGYTLPGASENLQQLGAYGIAFVLSVVLVVFTHKSGHELYRSNKIKHARQDWVEGGRKGKTNTGTVALAKPQSIDDDQPGYVQLMNRTGVTLPSYNLTIGVAIFVCLVAVLATYVRGQVLEKQLIQQITSQSHSTAEINITLSQDGLNMKATDSSQRIALPAEDAAANRNAEDKALADEVSIDRHGGWGTFIVLALFFVALQFLGVYFGHSYGFAGLESKGAFHATGAGRYTSYADVRQHYKDIADAAQSKLEHLQQQMMNRNVGYGNDGVHAGQSFHFFMETERAREMTERQKELQTTAQRAQMDSRPPVVAVAALAPSAPTPVEPPAPVVVATPDPLVEPALTLATVMQTLQTLGEDKAAKKGYIDSLPDSMRIDVIQTLTLQKQQTAQLLAKQRDAELDALL